MIHWAWVVLGSCFATLFINYSIRIGAYSVLLPEMIKTLDINMTQAGVMRAAYFSTYVIFSPLMGWLTDRIGGRFVISFFCLIMGTGSFLMGKTSSLSTGILFHAIVGMGAAAMWTPVVTLVQKWFGEKRRGLALGLLSPSYGAGVAFMGIILPLVVKSHSWRMGWFLLGISAWILVALDAFLLRSDPKGMNLLPWGETSKPNQPSPVPLPSFSYKESLKQRTFWLIGISYFFISIGAYIISDLIVTYGVIELKIPYPQASSLITVFSLIGIAGGMILMSTSDYVGRKKSLMIIHTSLTLAILFIIFAKGDLLLLTLGMGFFGFFYGSIWPMYAACTRDYFPKEVAGSLIGLMTIFYGTGAIVGPVAAGFLTDRTGTFRWSFALGAFSSIIGVILIGFLRKMRG